jgi:hypothetical protein
MLLKRFAVRFGLGLAGFLVSFLCGFIAAPQPGNADTGCFEAGSLAGNTRDRQHRLLFWCSSWRRTSGLQSREHRLQSKCCRIRRAARGGFACTDLTLGRRRLPFRLILD